MGFNQFGNPFGLGFNGGAFGRGGATKQGVLEKIGISSDKVAFYQSFRKGKKGIKDAMTVRRSDDSKTTIIPYRPNVAYSAPRNILHYNPITWGEWTNSIGVSGDYSGLEFTNDGGYKTAKLFGSFNPSTKYGLLFNLISNYGTSGIYCDNSGAMPLGVDFTAEVGNKKNIFTSVPVIYYKYIMFVTNDVIATNIKIKDVRIFELPTGSQIEADFTNLTADQLNAKYPMVDCNGAPFGANAGVQKDRVCNQFVNGDGRYGAIGWSGNFSSITPIDGGCRFTGNGSDTAIYGHANRAVSEFKTSASKRYYLKAFVTRPLNSTTYFDFVTWNGSAAKLISLMSQVSPGSTGWVKGIATQTDIGSTPLAIRIQLAFPDETTQNGKNLDVKYWSIIDMGDSSADPLYNKTEAEMDAWLASQPQAIAVEGGYYLPPYGLCAGELDLDVVANFGGSSQLLLTQLNGQDYAPVSNSTQSTATYQPKVWDNGLYYTFGLFDGVDDYLNADLPDITSAPCTWWVRVNKKTIATTWQGVVSRNNGGYSTTQYLVYITPSGTCDMYLENTQIISPVQIPTDKDAIAAFVWNGTTITSYKVVNGVLTLGTTVNYSGTLTSRASNKILGSHPSVGADVFKGEIQEIGIVNQALTADQIQKLWKL